MFLNNTYSITFTGHKICFLSQYNFKNMNVNHVSKKETLKKNAFLLFVLNVTGKIFCVKELEFLYLLKYYHMNSLICQK